MVAIVPILDLGSETENGNDSINLDDSSSFFSLDLDLVDKTDPEIAYDGERSDIFPDIIANLPDNIEESDVWANTDQLLHLSVVLQSKE